MTITTVLIGICGPSGAFFASDRPGMVPGGKMQSWRAVAASVSLMVERGPTGTPPSGSQAAMRRNAVMPRRMTSGILRPVALCKGVIYLASMEFIATRFGREGLAHVMGEVSAEDAAILRAVVAAGWYPIEPLLHMRRHMDRMYGQGDLALVRDLGRFSGDWQMHSVLKPLLRLTNPHWLVERGIRVWRQYHDSGSWEFLR